MIKNAPKKKRKYTLRKKAKVIKPKKPQAVFHGTTFEREILDVCAENKFPFDFRRAKIGGYVVDFINREKRLIIEVYNSERSWVDVMDRMRAFIVQDFKVKYLTKDNFTERHWETSLVTNIKRFLK